MAKEGLTKKQKKRLKKARDEAKAAGHEGLLFDRRDRPADYLRGNWSGAGVFLLCGGPSLARMKGEGELDVLSQRGIVTAAVNQAATVYRPLLWFSVDQQSQFSDAIWKDPGIIKFTKRKYMNRHLHGWHGDRFGEIHERPKYVPNVFGYEHTDMGKTPWNPAAFLTQPLPVWGSTNAENDPEGKYYHKSVMLVALRLLYWLGFRRVYLLGADFKMKAKRPYAFDEKAGPGRVGSNNQLFGWLDRRFAELAPYFHEAGYEVLNCTPGSRLRSFPSLDLQHAVDHEASKVPEIVTRGMYRL